MKKYLNILKSAVIALIFIAAIWLLYHELKQYRLRDIRSSISTIPAWRIAAAIGLMALNYLILVGYDLLAVRSLPHNLPLGKVAFASFTGNVCSFNFGPLFAGTSVRYRVYSLWGMSSLEIVRLMLMLFITFWIGAFTLAGIVFIVQPFPTPERFNLPFPTVQPLGFLLLAISAVYLAATMFWKKPIRFRGLDIRLPTPKITLSQICIASADLMVAAACLFVLSSHNMELHFFEFLGVYLLAVILVTFTHVPGGVGVFELVVFSLAAPHSPELMVASLFVYRLIYLLLPLLAAIVMLAVNEVVSNRTAAARAFSTIRELFGGFAPTLLGLVTFLAGVVLLFSSATPIVSFRRGMLEQSFPLGLVEASHFVASVTGAGLLLPARGLHRRLRSAFRLTACLLVVGIAASILKGYDFEVAAFLAFLLVVLLSCHRHFYRKGSLLHAAGTPGWYIAVLFAVMFSLSIGIFAYKHLEFSPDLWLYFTFRGDVSRSLRGSIGAGFFLLLFAFLKLLQYRAPAQAAPKTDEPRAVLGIVRASTSAKANLALLADKAFLFNDDRSAFVMYQVQGQSWVALGDPVGPESEKAELIFEFCEECDLHDSCPVFFQIGEEHLSIYRDQGFSLLKLGDEARVHLADFSMDRADFAELEESRQHLINDGCTFEILAPVTISDHFQELKEVSDGWLAGKNGAEKGFSQGFFDKQYLKHFKCAVVRKQDKIIGFTNLLEGGNHEELATDLLCYLPQFPFDAMEFLLVNTLLWGKQYGYQWFNLGLTPPVPGGEAGNLLKSLDNRTASLLFQFGDQITDLQFLRQSTERFCPVWTPNFLATPAGFDVPKILGDVVTLIKRT